MTHLSLRTSVVVLFLISYLNAQQCDQSSHEARFDCYPEKEPTKEKCLARNCCWGIPIDRINHTGLRGVPFCYYPKDFPTYEVVSNEVTDFGRRIQIIKSERTYMPNDILNLTVDLICETQQRFRLRIYDPVNQRYEVPLQVPIVKTKVNVTDYEIAVSSKPFALLVTRKSTGATL